MFQIAWTGPARGDLRRIETWLAREVSPDYALRALVMIRHRARFLERFPHGGRLHGKGLRILRVIGTPYLIRYRILEASESVQIRVHHEREDWFIEP